MKKAYYHLLFAGFLILSGCSRREAAPSERNYFIGAWKLSSPLIATPNPVETVLTFHKEGSLTLNIQFAGATKPDRRWNFDENAHQLQLFLPDKESYVLIEKATDHFIAKNTMNDSVLRFTRQN